MGLRVDINEVEKALLLQEIKKLANCKAEPVSQDLVKVSSILAALGHKTVW